MNQRAQELQLAVELPPGDRHGSLGPRPRANEVVGELVVDARAEHRDVVAVDVYRDRQLRPAVLDAMNVLVGRHEHGDIAGAGRRPPAAAGGTACRCRNGGCRSSRARSRARRRRRTSSGGRGSVSPDPVSRRARRPSIDRPDGRERGAGGNDRRPVRNGGARAATRRRVRAAEASRRVRRSRADRVSSRPLHPTTASDDEARASDRPDAAHRRAAGRDRPYSECAPRSARAHRSQDLLSLVHTDESDPYLRTSDRGRPACSAAAPASAAVEVRQTQRRLRRPRPGPSDGSTRRRARCRPADDRIPQRDRPAVLDQRDRRRRPVRDRVGDVPDVGVVDQMGPRPLGAPRPPPPPSSPRRRCRTRSARRRSAPNSIASSCVRSVACTTARSPSSSLATTSRSTSRTMSASRSRFSSSSTLAAERVGRETDDEHLNRPELVRRGAHVRSRSLCFCTSNSASVMTPLAFRSASSRSSSS